MKTKHSNPKLALCLILLMTLSLISSAASAQDSAAQLLRFSPEGSAMIIGVEVHEAIKNKAISSLIETLYLGRGAHELKTVAADKYGMVIERDVHAALIALPSPAQDQGLTDQFTVILSGKFDVQKIKQVTKSVRSRKVGELQVWGDPSFDFAFINPKTIAIVGGSTAYREQAWSTLSGSAQNALKAPQMSALLKRADTKNHQAWALIHARHISQPKGSPNFHDAIIEINTQAGIKLKVNATMRSAEDAAQSIKLIEAARPGLKKELAQIEATAAIDQLTSKATEDKLSLSTSLTPTQFLKVAQHVRAIRLRINEERPEKAAPQTP